LDKLKNILKKVLSDLEKEELSIVEIWSKAAGEKAAKHTRPAFLKAKRLVVNVSDSSWLYKLTLEKEALVKKVNAGLKGRKKIHQLQFRIGDI